MHCPNCQTIFKIKPNVCPICGHIFSTSQIKPSFEKTWGMICEEELRKHPSKKKFDEAWNWYQNDLNQFSNNSTTLRELAQFLQTYSTYPVSLPSNLNLSTFPASVLSSPWKTLLWLAFQQKDGSSALQLYWLDDSEIRYDLTNTLQDLRWKEDQTTDQAILYLLASHLKRDGNQARRAFKFLQHIEEQEPLILNTSKSFELLSGLSTTLSSRLEDLQTASQTQNMEFGLNCLYRPLTIDPICFDHLNDLPEEFIAFLTTHSEDWRQITLRFIQDDQALRGIHLALQTIQNQHPELQAICQPLLEAQYVQAYLRPFEQIEKSDIRF